jgi:CheY-like chemotaxis protein
MMNRFQPPTNIRPPDRTAVTADRLAQENDELRQRIAILSRSNHDLEWFAYAASHDLQEPLRAITLYAELLAQRCVSELTNDSARLVDNILQGGRCMGALLADLLAYAVLKPLADESAEIVDLNLVLEKVRRLLKLSIDESGAVVVSAELPILPAAHEVHFVQLFQNLIGNAIKYRSDANPLIQVSVRDTDGQLEVAVADNGLGIAPENHHKIFKAFRRLHDNDSSGTGIGLAICQHVVEGYGGRIWVDSEMGRGSTFRFTLPATGRPKQSVLSMESAGQKVHIVVVDDSRTDVELLRLALNEAELECELTAIEDGEEALAFMRQKGKYAGRPLPDLAVLDLNLPKNDGLEILEAMSRDLELARVPVAVLSTGVSAPTLLKIQKFTFAHYITKPSSLEEVFEIGLRLKALLESRSSGSDNKPAGPLAWTDASQPELQALRNENCQKSSNGQNAGMD